MEKAWPKKAVIRGTSADASTRCEHATSISQCSHANLAHLRGRSWYVAAEPSVLLEKISRPKSASARDQAVRGDFRYWFIVLRNQ
jgi:hypothetical protein